MSEGSARCVRVALAAVCCVGLCAALVLWAAGGRSAGDGADVQEDSTQDAPVELAEPAVASVVPRTVGGVPAVCIGTGTLLASEQGGLGARETWSVPGDVPDVAAAVLSEYRDSGDVSLEYSGYLDFLGNVWGCLVSGDGGVTVVVAQGDSERLGLEEDEGDGLTCTVTVMRLGEGEVPSGDEEAGG